MYKFRYIWNAVSDEIVQEIKTSLTLEQSARVGKVSQLKFYKALWPSRLAYIAPQLDMSSHGSARLVSLLQPW